MKHVSTFLGSTEDQGIRGSQMNLLHPYLLWKKLGILQTDSLFSEVLNQQDFLTQRRLWNKWENKRNKLAGPDGFTLTFKGNSRMRLTNYEQ